MTAIHILCVGKGRDRLLADLAGRYIERLSRLATVHAEHVPEVTGKGRRADETRRLEAERLRIALGEPARHGRAGGNKSSRGGQSLRSGPSSRGGLHEVVALDERGELLTSRELARLLGDSSRRGIRRMSFVIGGDEGLDATFLAEADRKLALSRMTLTHELARVLLLEQLYRAHAILAGHPYHRGQEEA